MRYLRQLAAACGVAVAGLGGFAACVSGDDSSGTPDATADATTDAGIDVATQPDVQTKDVAIDGPTGCAARTADDTAGIFVAQSGTDVSSCGTRANPCKTLAYSIATAKATTGKTTLYVAAPPTVDGGPGAYDESVTLDAALTIEGGWSDTSGTWTPICDATTSTAVNIVATTNITVTASFNGSATLRDLQLSSKAAAGASESLYGLFASGSATNLTLDQVVIAVGAGGAGADGNPGTNGAIGGDAGCTASNGQSGGAGPNGVGATAGSFTSNGYASGNGGDAGAGAAGNGGTMGGNPQCLSTCGECFNKQPSCMFLTNQTVCGQAGFSGCGGGGGTGGSAGTSGGSSVAVYVWDAHVTVFGGTFTTSNGGNGGSGGLGGDGGLGTSGAPGGGGYCYNNDFGCSSGFCVAGTGQGLNGGTAGGAGGHGGLGGQGGGGSGGFSYGIVVGGDGGVVDNGATIAHGDAGSGGAAAGANGQAGDKFP